MLNIPEKSADRLGYDDGVRAARQEIARFIAQEGTDGIAEMFGRMGAMRTFPPEARLLIASQAARVLEKDIKL